MVTEQPKSLGHPFYTSHNRLLAQGSYDALVSMPFNPLYAETTGRPAIVGFCVVGFRISLELYRAIA